jgi:HEAT repeat protein
MSETSARQKPKGRVARTLRSLLFITTLGVVLGVYNAVNLRRDISVATGPRSKAQRQFLVEAAERPDIATFFKNLTSAQRVAMARNIGQYDDPKLAKLIGVTLGDFDAQAREELTKSMTLLAAKQPEAVAEQLNQKGSFQQLAIQRALKTVGPTVVPMVVKQLSVADARPNAVAFLVEAGQPAVAPLLPILDHKEKDVRLAGADALGKLGAREAVPALVAKYNSSTGDEKFGYLAALSGIGDPSTEALMQAALEDPALALPQRAQAALGLGRIASPTAAATLWKYANAEEAQLRQSAVSGLQIAQDVALKIPGQDPVRRIEVASGVQTDLANKILLDALGQPQLAVSASRASTNRPALVAPLAARLGGLTGEEDGDVADAIIQTLATTQEGRAALGRFSQGSALSGLVARRLEQAARQIE